MPRVVIIGGGIGGLTSAALLARAGYKVELYEASSQVGGRAGYFSEQGFSFDTGPSWYLMPKVFERTYKLLGSSVSKELELTQLSPAYKVFFESSKPITITGNEAIDIETFEAIEPGAGAALKRYINEGDSIYELSLKYFLYTNFTRLSEFMRLNILRHGPRMLRLALTPLHRHVARYVADSRLQRILEYPMVFLGSSPFSAPAIYSLMSALDFREGVFYPKGGLYSIIQSIEALAQKAGVTIHRESEVSKIRVVNGKAKGIELADGNTIEADIVISNADVHHTETQLLEQPYRSYPERYWKKQEAGVSALLMYVGVKGDLPMLEHHNLLFVDSWHENFSAIYRDHTIPHPASMYVCNPSKSDSVAPAGHENLFILVPLPTGVSLTVDEQTKLADDYFDQFAETINEPDLKNRVVYWKLFGPNEFITRFHAHQASALGASHVLRQSALFRTTNKSKKVSNLFFVGGSTIPGIGLPMCLISAELAFERITGKKPELPL